MEIRKIKIEPNKTYASEANVDKAVEKAQKKFYDSGNNQLLRYFIMPTADGRFFPVFIGEAALQAGIHFHFNIVG